MSYEEVMKLLAIVFSFFIVPGIWASDSCRLLLTDILTRTPFGVSESGDRVAVLRELSVKLETHPLPHQLIAQTILRDRHEEKGKQAGSILQQIAEMEFVYRHVQSRNARLELLGLMDSFFGFALAYESIEAMAAKKKLEKPDGMSAPLMTYSINADVVMDMRAKRLQISWELLNQAHRSALMGSESREFYALYSFERFGTQQDLSNLTEWAKHFGPWTQYLVSRIKIFRSVAAESTCEGGSCRSTSIVPLEDKSVLFREWKKILSLGDGRLEELKKLFNNFGDYILARDRSTLLHEALTQTSDIELVRFLFVQADAWPSKSDKALLKQRLGILDNEDLDTALDRLKGI